MDLSNFGFFWQQLNGKKRISCCNYVMKLLKYIDNNKMEKYYCVSEIPGNPRF